MTKQNEEWSTEIRALRADLFAREGRLGRVEAELAAGPYNPSLFSSRLKLAVPLHTGTPLKPLNKRCSS